MSEPSWVEGYLHRRPQGRVLRVQLMQNVLRVLDISVLHQHRSAPSFLKMTMIVSARSSSYLRSYAHETRDCFPVVVRAMPVERGMFSWRYPPAMVGR